MLYQLSYVPEEGLRLCFQQRRFDCRCGMDAGEGREQRAENGEQRTVSETTLVLVI